MVMAPSACVPDEIYINTPNYPDDQTDQKRQVATTTHHGGPDLFQSRLASKDLIFEVIKKRVAGIDVTDCSPGEEDAFYVADMGEIYRQHLRWKMNLRRVKPFYGECSILRRVSL
jgi:ornithine decarboxylase